MPDYFRAVALDYDGTITTGPRPAPLMLAAIREVRNANRRVVLVTGRILAELLLDFPDALEHFDAVVAENGAVLWRAGRERAVVAPVSRLLDQALGKRGVPLRRGQVIVATDVAYDRDILEECARLGLDHQIVRNRAALMVLPAGVSKATGLREALAEFGISYHSTVCVGDAENDLALLDACEIFVAVGNAVPSLKEAADLVLETADIDALASFLGSEVLRGMPTVQPRRRRVVLGTTDDGHTVTVPASRVHLFIDGASGVGKSYLAGLFAEGLIKEGYAVCVLDMEGDNVGLGELPGVLVLGGREPLPPPEQIIRILQRGIGSVVLDLSLREPAVRHAFACDVLEQLTSLRRDCGLPHWIIVEEAHVVPSEALVRARACGSLCLVTYRPEWLPAAASRHAEIQLTVESRGRVMLRSPSGDLATQHFCPAAREVVHVRHHRKYADICVPFERGFTFRDNGGAIGRHVLSLAEFYAELEKVPAGVVAHHAAHRDFSRWFRDVFRDPELARVVRSAEENCHTHGPEALRTSLLHFLVLRYAISAASGRAGKPSPEE